LPVGGGPWPPSTLCRLCTPSSPRPLDSVQMRANPLAPTIDQARSGGPRFGALRASCRRVPGHDAPTPMSIVIRGETGTGKERVAGRSRCRARPLSAPPAPRRN